MTTRAVGPPTSASRAHAFLALLATGFALALLGAAALPAPVRAAAPSVETRTHGDLRATSARLIGAIDPGGEETTYRFEYGTAAGDHGSWTSVPVAGDASAGAGAGVVRVARSLVGLQPETTYHFRLVASNASGAVAGADRSFTTPATPPPAPARAYEMVSPVDKNDGDAQGVRGSTVVSDDGERLLWGAKSGIGDTQSNLVGSYYLTDRGAASWTTSPLSPIIGGRWFTLLGGIASTVAKSTPDLSKSIVHSWNPEHPLVSDDENTRNVVNLYLRDNETGTYELITKSANPIAPDLFYNPVFVGATPDFDYVYFQSTKNLTATATGNLPKIYQWHAGVVTVAGLLPGQSAPPAGGATGPTVGALNTTGASLKYSEFAVSRDASRVYFKSPAVNGSLYLRRDNSETVWAARSEASSPDPAPGNVLATGASSDGSKVVFQTAERLLDEDTPTGPDPGNGASSDDLYLYTDSDDPDDDANLTLVSKDEQPDDGVRSRFVGTLGTSTSGDGDFRVYFAANGRLVAGQQATECDAAPNPSSCVRFYMWEDGEVRFIGETLHTDGALDAAVSNNFIASASWEGSSLPASGRLSRVSADGRYLLFTSWLSATGYDHRNLPGRTSCTGDGLAAAARCFQLYLYDAEAEGDGELTCVSCPADGASSLGDAWLNTPHTGGSGWPPGIALSRALTDDGRVFFTAYDPLVPEDVDGKQDVYMYDHGRVSLITPGTGSTNAKLATASPDGRSVFFTTYDSLVGWDRDGNSDLYVARVGGGLPEPASPAEPCAGDLCQGAHSRGRESRPPGSSIASGRGNQAPSGAATFRVTGLRSAGRVARVRVRVPSAGRVAVRGVQVVTTARRVGRAGAYTLRVVLNRAGRRALADRGRLAIAVRVSFRASSGSARIKRAQLTFAKSDRKGR